MPDKPTNSLDMAGVAQLASARRSYEEALIVATQDVPFLAGERDHPVAAPGRRTDRGGPMRRPEQNGLSWGTRP
ncbi:hypothetical protein [Streptomyces sp. GD-15H]|uniref:hypothetical protein n=1 Tax=Streptomyces sp. GD-15H TaxID=3129112 RepID=UPI00387379B4